jgi:glycosyltransferase involved in cell wall biosynthesis
MIGYTYSGRVGLQQRVLPSYRAAFFDALAKACLGGLSVFAGKQLQAEGINPAGGLQFVRYVQAQNYYFSDPSSAVFMCWQGGIVHWLNQWYPDVLIVEANPRYLSTRQAVTWMHRRARSVIGWGLGAPPIDGFLAGLQRSTRSRFINSMDAVVAYSRQGAEEYRNLGFPPERVYVASNAVAPAPTTPPPPRPQSFTGRACVLFVGRLQSRKRVDLLLEACSKLPAEVQPRLLIVGDGPERNAFEALAGDIYPRAEFVGARHGAKLEPYFAQADLFVLPGTGGLAIQQAMAHALPVIVAQGDGTQDDLVRPENGWQVPPDNLKVLTFVLRVALSDPEKLRQMGDASYRIVSDEINLEKMVQVFVRVLNDLAKDQR